MKIVDIVRKYSLKTIIKISYDKAITPFVPGFHERRWKKFTSAANNTGVDQSDLNKIIVSLTTFPARIGYVHETIQSLLTQTKKPREVILWLASEQFPGKRLPDCLTDLQNYGLTIKWCDDIRSYKKLIPTLEEYPDSLIITADDDMYYHPKMIERLYNAYLKDPYNIQCHRVTKFYIQDGKYKTSAGGYDIYSHASFLHKLTGGSGALYPPASLHPDITNRALFKELAPTNDDIWFWFMALLNGRRCNVVKHPCTALYYVRGSQTESLSSINDNGEHLFWDQFNKMLEHYPEADLILKKEWERESKKE